MFNQIVFYIAFALILLFIFLTMWCKNIFRSLLSAICVFFLTAIFFFLLGSEYNAVIQLAVYGFAVPIILGIGIMFTNLRNTSKEKNKNSKLTYMKLLLYVSFIIAIVYFILATVGTIIVSNLAIPEEFNIWALENPVTSNSFNNLYLFSQGIFVRYVWAFELMALVLTIITAGLVIVGERKVR